MEKTTPTDSHNYNLFGAAFDPTKLGLGLFGNLMSFGSDLSDSIGSYAASGAKAFSARMGARGYDEQARMHARNVGAVQLETNDRIALRYDALMREISRQRVTAAGSGIDLSSRVVSRAETSSRAGARWDVDRISRTGQAQAYAENRNALAARKSSIWARAEARMAQNAGNAGLVNGIVGGLGRLAGGVALSFAGAYAGPSNGYGGFEDRMQSATPDGDVPGGIGWD